MADKTSRKSSQRTRLSLNNTKESSSTDQAASSTAQISQKKRKSPQSKEPIATTSFASNISKSTSLYSKHDLSEDLSEESTPLAQTTTKPKSKKSKKRKRNLTRLSSAALNTTTQSEESSDLLSKEHKVSRSSLLVDLASDEGDHTTAKKQSKQSSEQDTSDQDEDKSIKKRRLSSDQKNQKKSKRKQSKSQESDTEPIVVDQEESGENLVDLEQDFNYHNRLRRPSSSKSASSDSQSVKKQKLSKKNSKSPSQVNLSETESINTKLQQSKKLSLETGACTSKPSTSTSSSHLASSKRLTSPTDISTDNLQEPQETASTSKRTNQFDLSKFKTKLTMSQDSNNNNKNIQKTASKAAQSTASNIGHIESADSSDNDTTAEFSRLTDLLQARGLPSHIVNAFGSKVQQFLHRTMSSGITSRSSQLISSLQQHDESVKLTALTELCQLLVMGNEETLVGFPIKQAVPLLLQCMRSESENYDLMNHACRALTYMMESLPRSSSIIAEGIGVFLEKLQVIQCMDVAEQSLTALEILSRRHSKQILNATQSGSVSACLTYIDFFSITAQRNALQITANCCQNVIKDEFVHIQSSLPILSQRLIHSDKKSVESVCIVFARLVENFQRDRLILKEIASHNVLTNMQQLLVAQPPVVSSSIFVTVLHTIYLMCANCNELAIELLDNNIATTFRQLLIGPKLASEPINQSDTIEILSNRSPQELYEIVSIIGEIMPRLPQTGIFSIDETLRKTSLANQNEHVLWQWKDERDVWRPYTPVDSRIIESAYSQEEDECILNTMGRTYVLDFNSMLQINEDTGTTRPIARKVLASQTSTSANTTPVNSTNVNTIEVATTQEDGRLSYLNKNPNVYAQFVSSLFSILYEVYNSSAGPAIKHRSLRAILRMIYYSSNNDSTNNDDKKETNSENVLYNLLKTLPISSHIASMLASTDPKIIVNALQMCEILMLKMPDVFSVYFHREGVIHQIDRLIETGSAAVARAAAAVLNEANSEATASTSNQRKTRSSTAAAAAAVAALNTIQPRNPTNTEASSAKRKVRTSQASKQSTATATATSTSQTATPATSLYGTNSTPSEPTNQSLTSSTSKYFRNIITKMHGSSSNSNNNNNSSTASNTVTTAKPSNSTFQTFSLVAPGTTNTNSTAQRFATNNNNPLSSLSSSSNYYNSHNYLSQTTSSIQRNASNNEFSIYGRNDQSSGSLWNQLKSTSSNQAASSSLSSYNNLIPLSSTASTSRRKTNYNPIQSQTTSIPIVSLQQQQLSSIDYNLINQNKEKVKQWIYEQAKKFKETYFSQTVETTSDVKLDLVFNAGLNVLKRLKEVVHQLDLNLVNNYLNDIKNIENVGIILTSSGLDTINSSYLKSLKEISNILNETDISSFEMIHSGLIEKLALFLSHNDGTVNLDKKFNQLTKSTHLESLHSTLNAVYVTDIDILIKNEFKILRCKQFLNVFSNLPISFYTNETQSETKTNLFAILVSKLHNCVNQLEQFAVRVHDVPTSVGFGKTAAIKFFNTHQFKCLLRRHPACSTTPTSSKQTATAKTNTKTYSNVSQWKGGPVKVDPLAVVSTIEKYLICRGLHRPSVQTTQSTTASSNSFLSSSLPTSSLSQAKLKSTKSKSPSSRLFMFKAAAEAASDRFKSRKSKQPKTTSFKSISPKKLAKAEPISVKIQKTDKSKITKVKKTKKSKSMNSSAASSVASSSTAAASTSSKTARIDINKSKKSKKGKSLDLLSKSFSAAQDLIEETEEDLEEDEDEDQEEDDFDDLVEESIDNDEYDFNEDVDISNDDNEQVLDLEDDEEEEDEEEGDDLDETYENQIAEEEIEEESDNENLDEEEEDDDDDDDDDDNDIESAMNAILGANSARSGAGASSASFKNFYLSSFSSNSNQALPKFELLINDHVLPSNMSIYQAIKLYSTPINNNNTSRQGDDLDNDIESSLLNNAIWSKVHLIHYRLAEPATTTTPATQTVASPLKSDTDSKRTTRQTKSKLKSKSKNKSDLEQSGSESLPLESEVVELAEEPANINKNISSTVFYNNLTTKMAHQINTALNDQSMDAISLLRLLNQLNRDWYLMYNDMYSDESLVTSSGLTTTDNIHTQALINSDQFVNTKLTAKANRQLQDPLVIMTGHLPKWLPELMKSWPFLFPFKTRLMYFYVSSLDRDRAMQRLIDMNSDIFQNDTTANNNVNPSDRFVPKLEKKKRTIIRANDLIKQADTIISEFAVNNGQTSSGLSTYSYHKPALLEIQYENEVGTGLGPTLEFYALVSLEVQKCEYELWRGEKMQLTSAGGDNQNQLFYFSQNGLFPAPVVSNGKLSSKQQTHLTKLKSKFKFIGKFFAKAIMDSRVVDIPLSQVFYKWLIDQNSLCADDIKYMDLQLYKSIESLKDYLRKRRHLVAQAYKLKENVDEQMKPILKELTELEKTVLSLDLDFTLPGYNHIELKKGGKDIIVNLENLEEYLKLIVDWTLITGVEKQFESFREGFESILSINCLQQFYPEELERLFCGSGYHEWTMKSLNECTRCDHGYTHESQAVKYLFEIMCAFTSDEQREFLQFITGSPRLPVGGLRSLVPPLTIVRKSAEGASSATVNADSYLPSVMTCVNYLKLPDYTSLDIMRDKLFRAMKDGQLSFHLS